MVKQFSIGIGLGAIFFAVFLLALPASAGAACSTTNSPGVNKITTGVVLYEHDDCKGNSTVLDGSTTPSQWDTIPSSVGNDEVSSLILKGNISVFLYENINGGGLSICWNSPQKQIIPSLKSEGFGWNDKLSSIKIGGPGECTSPGEQLPIGATCSPLGGIPSNYQCSGSAANAGILLSGQDGKFGNCNTTCRAADGSTLKFGVGNQDDTFQWYCFGATEEGSSCGAGDGQEIDVATGIKKEAEDCGFLGIGCLLTILINTVTGLLDVLIFGLAALTKALATALAMALNKVIAYAISVPVSPSSPDMPEKFFVRYIWEFSRSLANNFFILILAIIGLTTILRIQTYQWQKTFPALVIAVLLINFSGVLVGFVVDMANIVTNALLSKAVSTTTWGVQDLPLPGTEDSLQKLTFHVGEIIFYFFLSFAYFATMLLFVIRTVALWIIAAVGPLAFALYVLPATRTYWQQWFKALFQWAIMGIPAAFAIYFASYAISLTGESIGASGTPPAFFAQAVGPFTAAIILIVGMGMALAGAPAVSQSVMKFGRGLPKKLADTRIGAKVLGGAAGGAAGALAGARVGQRLEGMIRKVPGGGVLKYAVRPLSAAEGALGVKAIEYAASKRKWQPPKNWDQLGVVEQEADLKFRNLGSRDLVQAAAKMGKNLKYASPNFQKAVVEARNKTAHVGYLRESVGEINDIMTETVTKDVLINMKVSAGKSRDVAEKEVKDELATIVGDIEKDAAIDTKLRIALDAEIAGGKSMEDIAAAVKSAKELKPQDIANVFNPKTLSFKLAMRDSNPANLQRIIDSTDQATLQEIFTGVGGLDAVANTPVKLKALYKKNPRLVRALFTNPALQGMAWEGRNQLLDIFDKPTGNFDAFARRERAQEIAQANPDLQAAHDLFRDMASVQEKRRTVQTDAEIHDVDEQIQSINDRLNTMKEEILKTSPAQTRNWEELEGIMRVPSGTGARRGGRTGRRRGRQEGEEEYRGG